MAKKDKTTPIAELVKVFPGIDKVADACTTYPALIHASNILGKANKCITEYKSKTKNEKLNILIPEYLKYLDAKIR